MICDGVFEGGGVKGIGHVGAVYSLEEAGYKFERVAGSSAGAIVSALIAAGYSGREMKELMTSVDYLKFREEDGLDKLGNIGKFFSVLFHYGIYSADYLERWLNALLKEKHACCFGDVKLSDGSYRLQVTSVDLTTQKLLVFPRDFIQFHIDIDSFPIARAVRMSMSIPIFYEPYRLKDAKGNVHYMVDGGMLSNYPIWILDDGESITDHPVFGFRFVNNEDCSCRQAMKPCHNVIDYAKLMVSTLVDAKDNFFLMRSKGDCKRSVFIPSDVHIDGQAVNISATDFDISKAESESLFQNGYEAGKRFAQTFDFQNWSRIYRSHE